MYPHKYPDEIFLRVKHTVGQVDHVTNPRAVRCVRYFRAGGFATAVACVDTAEVSSWTTQAARCRAEYNLLISDRPPHPPYFYPLLLPKAALPFPPFPFPSYSLRVFPP